MNRTIDVDQKQAEEGRPAPTPRDSGPVERPRHRRRTALRIALWVLGAAVLLVLADGYLQSYRIGTRVRDLLPRLEQLRAALTTGTTADAALYDGVFAAAARVEAASGGARFTLRWTAGLPLLGRPADAAVLTASAVDDSVEAVRDLRTLLEEVSGPDGSTGQSQLIRDGVFDIDAVRDIVPRAERIAVHLRAARDAIADVPSIPLVGIDAQRAEALDLLDAQVRLADRVLAGLRALPSILGADGPRLYFVGLQNNADLRATGGTLLAYGLVRAEDGRVELLESNVIHELVPFGKLPPGLLGKLRVSMPASIRWWLRATHRYPLPDQAVTFEPHFPSVASTWARQLVRLKGVHVDGVILLDPYAIAHAMRGQPSISIPTYPRPISSQNLVYVTENDQYRLPPDDQAWLPGHLIQSGFELFLKPRNVLTLAGNLSTALAERRVQLWFSRPGEQSLIERLGWDGSVRETGRDRLFVTRSKRITNKVDYYTDQSITYVLRITPSGDGIAEVTVRLDNHTPPGQPWLIAGEDDWYGLNVAMLSLFAPERAGPITVAPTEPLRFPTRPAGLAVHREHRSRVATKIVEAWPDEPAEVTFRYVIPDVARRVALGMWRYDLFVQHQPLARPAQLEVEVHLPPFTRVCGSAPGWTPDGGVATFRAELVRDVSTTLAYC